jgi:hypothetical protein
VRLREPAEFPAEVKEVLAMFDPGLTLDRFGWDEDDVTITEPEEDA